MPSVINLQYPKAKLKTIERVFRDTPRTLTKIFPRAINVTMRTSTAQAARLIKADVDKLRIGDIKKRMRQQKAKRYKWAGFVHLSGAAISMSRFAFKQNKSGVPFRIKAGRKIITRAFRLPSGAVMIRKPTGESGAFLDWRTGQVDGSGSLVKRTPIDKLIGPSLSDLYLDAPGTVNRVTAQASDTLATNVDREVNHQIIRRLPR